MFKRKPSTEPPTFEVRSDTTVWALRADGVGVGGSAYAIAAHALADRDELKRRALDDPEVAEYLMAVLAAVNREGAEARPTDHESILFNLRCLVGSVVRDGREKARQFLEVTKTWPVGVQVLEYEAMVLGIVTESGSRNRPAEFASAVAEPLRKRVRSWLHSRLAPDRIRQLEGPIPRLFAADGARAAALAASFAGLLVVYATTPPSVRRVAGEVLLWLALTVPILVMGTGVLFRRARPFFLPRVSALLGTCLVLGFADSAWNVGLMPGPRLGVAAVIVSIGLSLGYWHYACDRAMGRGMLSDDARAKINERSKMLFSLHLEECVAVTLAADLFLAPEILKSRPATFLEGLNSTVLGVPGVIESESLGLQLHPWLFIVGSCVLMSLSVFTSMLVTDYDFAD